MGDRIGRALKVYLSAHWRYLLRHWFLLVLIGLVWAIIAGWVGTGFGMPLLFRDDPAYEYQFAHYSLNRPSIAGYTAATLLLAAFLAVVHILEIPSTRKPASAGRRIRQTLSFFAVAGALPLALLILAAALPSFELADHAPACLPGNTNCTPNGLETSAIDGAGPWFHPREVRKVLIGVFIGSAIAFAAGCLIFLFSSGVARILPKVDARAPWLRRRLGWMRHLFSLRARRDYGIVLGTVLTIALTTTVLSLLSSHDVSLAAMARPGAAICIFFGIILVFYFLIMLLAPSLRFIGVIALLALHASVGADRYMNELPGFAASRVIQDERVIEKVNYYDCLLPLDEQGKPLGATRSEGCGEDGLQRITLGPRWNPKSLETPAPLTAGEWVELWKPKAGETGPQKLVVIAAQGGAYRASFWTSLVLDELVQRDRNGELDGLVDRIGLLTGASGGMVGSAYFTVMAARGNGWHRRYVPNACGMNAKGDATWRFGPVTSRLCLDIFNTNHDENTSSKFTSPRPIARDSLTPLAAQTLLYDIPRVLSWPLTGVPLAESLGLDRILDWNADVYHDRGLILERQWGALHKSYAELARQQAALRRRGERHPSMIISPMIADTGQPILISNLELKGLVEGGDGEAVSMFGWFPDIREDFRVQTAVRMNAAFPYISPATSLPTTARRRVVDAGYYDNYGVNTAMSWLFQDDVIDVLSDPDLGIDGVVIIQIRAFPGLDQGRLQTAAAEGDVQGLEAMGPDASHEKERHRSDLPLMPEWLTSPLAGILSARSGSMAYRNDAQIERLAKVLEAKSGRKGFVQSIVFENHAEADQVGVSWHITPNELATLERELTCPRNARAFERLKRFWQSPASEDHATPVAEVSDDIFIIQPAAGRGTRCQDDPGPR